jgi:Na+/H+-translocating membrane pyrophosphatase
LCFVFRWASESTISQRSVTEAFLIIGCMIPYWFAALTMKSVGKAAGEMVAEVKRQFSIKDRSMSRVQATVRCHDATMFL